MKLRNLFTIVVLLLITSTIVPSIAKADDAPTKVTIDMNEYHFVVEGQTGDTPLILKAGTLYDLTVKNTGSFPHEIWFGKDAKMVEDEGRLDGYSTNLLTSVPVAIISGQPDTPTYSEIDVPGLTEIAEAPNQSYTIEFTLPSALKGKWEMGCFQPMPKPVATSPATGTPVPDVPHYMVGMKLDINVQ